MKKTGLILFYLFITLIGFSQQGNFVTNAEYKYRKEHNTLQGDEIILSDQMINPNTLVGATHTSTNFTLEKSSICDGYFPSPGTPYNINWSPDDGSGPLINLPFTYCFFGDNKTQVYMNNNGNISFGSAISSFNSSAFPSSGNQMIAAFWADFDFNSCGQMFATTTPTAAIFNWVEAGYYSGQCDKKNTCQIVITNGTDPILPYGNTAIYYDDMNWTTGSASSGTNGFGGTPATAGANRGNNIDYFQIGRFDHAGTDYDGPLGVTDGVDFLDNKSYIFNFCNSAGAGNIAPIPNNPICDTLGVCHSVGDTLDITFPFIAPENSQLTTVSFSSTTLTNIQVVSNTVGYTGILRVKIIGALENVGFHDLIVTGTDNYSTPGITSFTYKVEVTDESTAFPITPEISFVQGCAPVTIGVNNSSYDDFLWSTGSTDSITTINSSYNDTLSVDVFNGGCMLTLDSVINIIATPYFNLQGPLQYCPADLTTHLYLPDSLLLDSVHWVLNSNPTIINTDFSPNLIEGVYTARIWSISSYCFKDTTFTITTQPNLVLSSDTTTCIPSITLAGNTGGVGAGTWTVLGTPILSPIFSNQNLNPTVTFSGYGTFDLVYTENGCQDKDTIKVTWEAPPILGIVSDFFVCPGVPEHISIKDSTIMQSVTWGITPPSADTLFSTNIQEGVYNVHLVSQNGCVHDSTFTVTTQLPVTITDITQDPNNYYCLYHFTDTIMTNVTGGGTVPGVWSSVTPIGAELTYIGGNTGTTTEFSVSKFGDYVIIYTDPTCNDIDSLNIRFTPLPYAETDDYKVCQGNSQVIFTNILYKDFVTSIIWNTGETTETITVTQPGNYTLSVSTACGSPFLATSNIDVRVCDIEMPNIFSPNGDGINDLYHIKGEKEIFKTFHIAITDRWGALIKEYDEPLGTWDGTNNSGTMVSQGVYFYNVTATTLQDEPLLKNGFIHVSF